MRQSSRQSIVEYSVRENTVKRKVHRVTSIRIVPVFGHAQAVIDELDKLARAMGIEEQSPDEDTDYNKGMRDAAIMLRLRIEELQDGQP
jgi:hypothetical protein